MKEVKGICHVKLQVRVTSGRRMTTAGTGATQADTQGGKAR